MITLLEDFIEQQTLASVLFREFQSSSADRPRVKSRQGTVSPQERCRNGGGGVEENTVTETLDNKNNLHTARFTMAGRGCNDRSYKQIHEPGTC